VNEGEGLIVVGVDGSPHARRALEWALAEARLRGGRCLLVHAYELGAAGSALGLAEPLDALQDAATAVLDQELSFARPSGVEVEGRKVPGPAAPALVEASRQADLLVVGSRGLGGIKGALLGSVSIAAVHHAVCPIVVIPPPERMAAPEG
jgi:nucleotide-binding universal stress UspA family protein